MGDPQKTAKRADVLRCFARLAAQAALNAGQAHVHGRTSEERSWEVTARVLRAFVAYAANHPRMPLTGVVPGPLFEMNAEGEWQVSASAVDAMPAPDR